MLHGQRQLLSFLYLGRGDDNCLTLSGKEVEEIVAETGSLNGDFDKDVFGKTGRKQGQFTFAFCQLHLAVDGLPYDRICLSRSVA